MSRTPDWTELAMPKFAIMTYREGVAALYCKACGTQIAEHNGRSLVYSTEYTEAKLLCDDGSFHITNGCDICIHTALTYPQLMLLMQADAAFDPALMKDREPLEVVEVGRGLT